MYSLTIAIVQESQHSLVFKSGLNVQVKFLFRPSYDDGLILSGSLNVIFQTTDSFDSIASSSLSAT